jgi:hypothetical protein
LKTRNKKKRNLNKIKSEILKDNTFEREANGNDEMRDEGLGETTKRREANLRVRISRLKWENDDGDDDCDDSEEEKEGWLLTLKWQQIGQKENCGAIAQPKATMSH